MQKKWLCDKHVMLIVWAMVNQVIPLGRGGGHFAQITYGQLLLDVLVPDDDRDPVICWILSDNLTVLNKAHSKIA